MTRFTGKAVLTSTAIATILSLTMPAHAEIVLSPQAVKAQGESRAGRMPLLQGLLSREIEAGLRPNQLSCLDGSPRPCADDMPLITPKGVAVQLGQNDEFVLAPPDLQPYSVDKNGTPLPRGGRLQPLAEARLNPGKAPVEAPAAPADDNAAKAKAAADKAAQEQRAAQQAAEAEKQAAAAAAKATEREDVLAAELAKAQAEVANAKKQTENAKASADRNADTLVRADRYRDGEHRVDPAFAAKFQSERADYMPELNKILQAEIRSGLAPNGLTCSDGSARPCADGVSLMSPGGVAVEVTREGRIIMGRAVQQINRIGDDGKIIAHGANTQAAREAAEATAPTADALDNGGKGKVVSEKVTQDTARKSSEDFETKLSDALAQAAKTQGNQREAEESSGGSDLAKGALAGLAALAVGQMLNGNRQVALNTGDRVVVTRDDGSQQVLKDDNALLRQPGSDVQTENFSDGSSRSVVTRADGSKIITIRAADLSVLRRTHVAPGGTETVLIDDSVEVAPVEIAQLPQQAAAAPSNPTTEAALREALAREAAVDRRFTLSQIRSIPEVRNLIAPVDINAITFDTGSAAISPDQARDLATLGTVIEDAVSRNPREVFLIEGHTDAVGAASYNLALSDRRAESVALALSEYFSVPPENLVVQGYGEEYLKIPTMGDERANRRASVRSITSLLATR